jgi:two-component system cell cycle sensor histidine kinase/response regulator CckA
MAVSEDRRDGRAVALNEPPVAGETAGVVNRRSHRDCVIEGTREARERERTDKRVSESVYPPADADFAAADTEVLGLHFSRSRTVAMRATIVASLTLVGLLIAEDFVPGMASRAVVLATGVALCALLILGEFARRDVIAARRKLFRSDKRLSFTQAAARIGSWEVDAEGVEYWSSSFRDLVGVTASTPASTAAFHALVHPDDREAVAIADARMLTEAGEHEFECRILRPDGVVRCMLARGVCILSASGAREHVLGVAIDITERRADEQTNRQLEQQLIQAHRLETVGRLAGGIAHDFNNLLTGINGYADLARACLDEGRSPREEVEEIRASGARAVALTRQLLAFSRQQILQIEAVDLNAVVGEAEKLLERVIGEDIRIEHVRIRDRVIINADRTQLEQVIVNLVVNARDAMPSGGQVTIEVDEISADGDRALDLAPGRYALLAVTDTGNGMNAETAAQIFDPFYTTKEHGTGLGLATVHGIVAQTGGTIQISSEPGQGTTFTVYLPLATAGAEAAPHRERQASPSPGAGEHVLVVEDDRPVRAIVKQMLERQGYEVTTAADATEALATAAGPDSFDLILSDLVMPDMSGRELVDKLTRLQPAAAVLYMSGYSDDAVRHKGIISPGTALLEKPFSSDELARGVRKALAAERSDTRG